MAEARASLSVSETITTVEERAPRTSPVLKLKLRKPKNDKKVKWTTETVDNEHMDKKKSKCCCIYEKPKIFGESSSSEGDSDDDCTGSCRGHKKKCYRHDHPDDPGAGHSQDVDNAGGPGTTG
ncbi:hypothetical protein ScPMuIL_011113 [Solemya velum]